MTPRPGGAEPVDDGLRAVRLTVLVFMVLDVVTTPIGQAYGIPDLGPAGPLPVVQGVIVIAAAVATMWNRPWAALSLTALTLVLVLVAGSSGADVWLLVITGVVVSARARWRQALLALLAQIAYAVSFGLTVEARRPGLGWPVGLTALGLAAAADMVGLVARQFFRARDRRRTRIDELRGEQAEIRAHERARLADDLQAVVTSGLAGIDDQVERVAHGPREVGGLRCGLARIEAQSRTLLGELRVLLEVLRREPEVGGGAAETRPRRWVDLTTARHVRIAATAVFGLLAGRAVLGQLGVRPDADLLVQVLGLLAGAVTVWRPRTGAIGAVATLALSTALDTPGHWSLLPLLVLCLLGAFRGGPRRFWLVPLLVGAYAVLLGFTDASDPVGHIVLVGIVTIIAIAVGLAARSFLDARGDALRQLGDLQAERDRVPVEERHGAARELHDVVAHQLSLLTMEVMAAGPSDDPAVLVDTLDKVRRRTGAARLELGTMLSALRGPGVAPAGPMPLVTPVATVRALADRLTEHGHHPVLEIDPAADALDPTTQRTLSRVLQEATTNLLRYAPGESRCSFTLAVDGDGVRLRVASPLASSPRTSPLSSSWGLRGLRERVDLSQGTFSAGPDGDGHWVVAVDLPAARVPATAAR